jgi:FHS family L-fucose permease-like MFS transporter
MFIYLGAQRSVNTYRSSVVEDRKPSSDQLEINLISRGIFTFGCFLGGGLAYFGVPPRVLLGVYILGAFLTSLLVLVLPQGIAALSMLLMVVIFQSTIFPTLYSMTLGGQGKHAKFAAAAVTIAISGSAA